MKTIEKAVKINRKAKNKGDQIFGPRGPLFRVILHNLRKIRVNFYLEKTVSYGKQKAFTRRIDILPI